MKKIISALVISAIIGLTMSGCFSTTSADLSNAWESMHAPDQQQLSGRVELVVYVQTNEPPEIIKEDPEQQPQNTGEKPVSAILSAAPAIIDVFQALPDEQRQQIVDLVAGVIKQ